LKFEVNKLRERIATLEDIVGATTTDKCLKCGKYKCGTIVDGMCTWCWRDHWERKYLNLSYQFNQAKAENKQCYGEGKGAEMSGLIARLLSVKEPGSFRDMAYKAAAEIGRLQIEIKDLETAAATEINSLLVEIETLEAINEDTCDVLWRKTTKEQK